MSRDKGSSAAHRSVLHLAAGAGVVGAVLTVWALLWGAVLFGVVLGVVTVLIAASGFDLWRKGDPG